MSFYVDDTVISDAEAQRYIAETISTPVTAASRPIVDFVVYPTDLGFGAQDGNEFIYATDGNTYATGVYTTPTSHSVTFDTVGYVFAAGGQNPDSPSPDVPRIVEYFWNFGDGEYGYGPVVSHKFHVPNPQAHVSLRITDSKGKQYWCGRHLCLTPGFSGPRFIHETISGVDLAQHGFVGARGSSDSVAGTDSPGRASSYPRATADTASATDAVTFIHTP